MPLYTAAVVYISGQKQSTVLYMSIATQRQEFRGFIYDRKLNNRNDINAKVKQCIHRSSVTHNVHEL